MNLHSKNIKIGTKKINASVSSKLIDDLKEKIYYEYKFENDSERLLIEKYFKIDHFKDGNIYYFIDIKVVRKIKLLVINNDESAKIIQEIIKKSKRINAGYGIDMIEAMELALVDELSKSINNEIIKRCFKL